MLCHCLVNCCCSFCKIWQFIEFTQLKLFSLNFNHVQRSFANFCLSRLLKKKICILRCENWNLYSYKFKRIYLEKYWILKKALNRVSSTITTWCSFSGNCFDRSLKLFDFRNWNILICSFMRNALKFKVLIFLSQTETLFVLGTDKTPSMLTWFVKKI